MNLEELMDNPYAWLILSVCTVFSVIYAIYAGVKGKEKKEISYIVNTHEIVQAGKNMIPEFQISYRGQTIDDLTVTRFAIWNSGNRLLNSNDIVDTKPLSITSNDDGPDILDASIIKRSEESNKFTIDKKSAHCAELQFDYIDKQDGIIVQILHTGSAKNISLSTLIKGGKKLKNVEKRTTVIKNKKVFKVISTVLTGIEMLFLLTITMAITFERFGLIQDEAFSKFMQSDPKWNPFVLVAIMDVLCVIATMMYFRLLKKLFHLNVPSSLRDSIEYNS